MRRCVCGARRVPRPNRLAEHPQRVERADSDAKRTGDGRNATFISDLAIKQPAQPAAPVFAQGTTRWGALTLTKKSDVRPRSDWAPRPTSRHVDHRTESSAITTRTTAPEIAPASCPALEGPMAGQAARARRLHFCADAKRLPVRRRHPPQCAAGDGREHEYERMGGHDSPGRLERPPRLGHGPHWINCGTAASCGSFDSS